MSNRLWAPCFICECRGHRAVSAVDAHTFKTFWQKANDNCLLNWWWNSSNNRPQQSENVTAKQLCRAIHIKICGILISSVMLLNNNAHTHIQIEQYRSILTGGYLNTFLRALISLCVTSSCLLTWKTSWDHTIATIMGDGRCQNVSSSQVVDIFNTGTQKLILWYDNYLNSTGGYAV